MRSHPVVLGSTDRTHFKKSLIGCFWAHFLIPKSSKLPWSWKIVSSSWIGKSGAISARIYIYFLKDTGSNYQKYQYNCIMAQPLVLLYQFFFHILYRPSMHILCVHKDGFCMSLNVWILFWNHHIFLALLSCTVLTWLLLVLFNVNFLMYETFFKITSFSQLMCICNFFRLTLGICFFTTYLVSYYSL